jgi:hypothetical protein
MTVTKHVVRNKKKSVPRHAIRKTKKCAKKKHHLKMKELLQSSIQKSLHRTHLTEVTLLSVVHRFRAKLEDYTSPYNLKQDVQYLKSYVGRAAAWKSVIAMKVAKKAEITARAKCANVSARLSYFRRTCADIEDELQRKESSRKESSALSLNEPRDAIPMALAAQRARHHSRGLCHAPPPHDCALPQYYIMTNDDLVSSSSRLRLKKRLVKEKISAVSARSLKQFDDISGRHSLHVLLTLLLDTNVVAINLGENVHIDLCNPLEALRNHVVGGGPIRRYFIEPNIINKKARIESGLCSALKNAVTADQLNKTNKTAAWLQLDDVGWLCISHSKCPMGQFHVTKATAKQCNSTQHEPVVIHISNMQ